jgi:hypothetical protein
MKHSWPREIVSWSRRQNIGLVDGCDYDGCNKSDRILSMEAAINIMGEGPGCDVWKM